MTRMGRSWEQAAELDYDNHPDDEGNRLAELQAEIDCLWAWVEDLQSGQYVNCVYCGHRYGPEDSTPVSQAEILTRHVEQCPKHPLSKCRAENRLLWEALEQRTLGYDQRPDGGWWTACRVCGKRAVTKEEIEHLPQCVFNVIPDMARGEEE